MTHLLDDCWLLVDRAQRQFDALRLEVIQFFEDNPADLVVEDDPNTGEKVVYFAQEPVLPRDWGLDVGQLVNNARTALDHLVYALAIEGGGNPEEAKTAFPIFEDRDEYWKVRGRGARKTTVRDQYLDGVDETWRKKVDAVQPYRHGDRAWLDPLAVLSEIANWHKHKTLKPARITIETPSHIGFAVGGRVSDLRVRFDPTRKDHVSVQAKMPGGRSLTPPGLIIQPKVEMEMGGGIQPGLVFGEPPRFYVLAQIKRAVGWSRSVLKWFEPAFDPPIET
jgi:hypothetical protein